jgi:hypothetical protein
MMPGGHLLTAALLSGTAYALTGSTELAAGSFAGGFLIDFDHYLDYVFFEGQWTRPGPASFLRYYFRNELQRVVLPLHSLELMMLLGTIAAFRPHPLLVGYLIGAALHLAFDIVVNGDYVIRRPVLFYFFAYRASNNFAAADLLDKPTVIPGTGSRPWREFFTWRPPVAERPKPDAAKTDTTDAGCEGTYSTE